MEPRIGIRGKGKQDPAYSLVFGCLNGAPNRNSGKAELRAAIESLGVRSQWSPE